MKLTGAGGMWCQVCNVTMYEILVLTVTMLGINLDLLTGMCKNYKCGQIFQQNLDPGNIVGSNEGVIQDLRCVLLSFKGTLKCRMNNIFVQKVRMQLFD